MRRQLVVALLAALFLVAAGSVALATVRNARRPPPLHGVVIESPRPASDFTLRSSQSTLLRLSDLRGKIVVLFFGYTNCPDVCPLTLAKVLEAKRQLGRQSSEVDVLMITVDPERDAPDHLALYMRSFGPSFRGLTGTPDEIAAAAAAYGVYYRKGEAKSPTEYAVEHTASTFVIDRRGFVRLVFPYEITGGEMADDLRYLLSGG